MSSDWEAIRRVVEAFDRSDWSEIDVRWGDVRVHLATRAAGAVAPPRAPAVPTVAPASVPPAAPDGGPPAGDGPAALEHPGPVPAGTHVVVAPSPGIFWRAPEPGAPPFVEVGDEIDDSTTLCIIEVMKLMSHLKTGTAGTVVAIYGTNGLPVAKGQPLVAIAPFEPSP